MLQSMGSQRVGHPVGTHKPRWVVQPAVLACDEWGTTWFLRVAAGFSSYNGKFRLPLVLAQ